MPESTAPAVRAAEMEKALTLLDQVDLILNAEHLVAGADLMVEVDAAEEHLTDLVTAVQGLQASLQEQRVAPAI